MIVAYQTIAGNAVRYLRGHPRFGQVLLPLASAGLLTHVILFLWRRYSADRKRSRRQEKAKNRAKEVAKQVEQVTDYERIVRKPVHELREELRAGKLTALQVLHAFQKQALKVTDDINCVTEPIPEAEQWAKALDASTGFKGLLHGIPVSVKENVALKGYDTTGGMEYFIDQNATEDSVIVKVLKQHGAVPFVRTNIPQTMLSYDCTNPLYGASPNPQDKTRTSGGSSSGEGALIGGGGSIMGIGNDIGGSLRVPAEFCGIFALKPTWSRSSGNGMFSTSKGQIIVRPTNGPMARDFDSLLLLSQAFFSPPMFELDPSLPNLPFDMEEYSKKSPMRIGFYTYDGVFQCQPPNVRAVMEAKAALESMGHTVVAFDFPKLLGEGFNGGEYFVRVVTADRLSRLRKKLANDRLVPSISLYSKLGSMPRWVVKCARFIAGFKDHIVEMILGAAIGFRDVEEYLDHIAKVEDFRERFMKVWQDQNLDAVICPVFPSPAVSRETVAIATVAGIYCWLYNTLNYPAGVVPVTKVTQDDLDKTFDPKHFQPQALHERILLKSSKNSVGLSVGVQCVSLPYREETCLRVMRDLTQALGKAPAEV